MRSSLFLLVVMGLLACSPVPEQEASNGETVASGAATSVPTVASGAAMSVPTVASGAATSVPTVASGAATSVPTVASGAATSVPTVASSAEGLSAAPTSTPDRAVRRPLVPPTPSATPTVAPTRTSEPPEADPAEGASITPQPDKTIGPTDYEGDVRAIRTDSGLMLAVRGGAPGRWEVVTPCYELATLTGGLPITGPIDVLIDPGHGGEESGAVGPNGLIEAVVNLRVAELLRVELIERGYRVELTRFADERVAIQSRTELANALQPKVFISIHHNGGFPSPFDLPGTEVFVQRGNDRSRRLGGLIFEEVQRALVDIDIDWVANDSRGVSWRVNGGDADLYGVLRRTPGLVSVLTEAMFVTSGPEAELLTDPETARIEAVALAEAIDRWFTTEDPGSGFIDGLVFRGNLGTGGGTEGCVDPDLS